jgi:hypothetical protein
MGFRDLGLSVLAIHPLEAISQPPAPLAAGQVLVQLGRRLICVQDVAEALVIPVVRGRMLHSQSFCHGVVLVHVSSFRTTSPPGFRPQASATA